jgi:hypothetical protein
MERLSAVSCNTFKIEPSGSNEAGSGRIVRFVLPSNAYVNMSSVRLMFNAEAIGTLGRLPNKTDSFIERVSVSCGGVMIQNSFSSYNLLRHAKDAICGNKCDASQNHPECVRKISYHTGADMKSSAEAYKTKDNMLVVDFHDTLLKTIAPTIIDTGLLPELSIEIQLADDAVCPSMKGHTFPSTSGETDADDVGTGCTFKLTNLQLLVEVMGFGSGVLDQVAQQRIAAVNHLSIPFQNHFSFSFAHQGTSRISVNTASLDRLWFVWRDSSYATQGGLQPVEGYKVSGAFLDKTKGGTSADVDIGLPQYDEGGVFDTNSEKYVSKYFKMSDGVASGIASYGLTFNGASIPAFKMNVSEFLSVTKNSCSDISGSIKNMTLDQYRNSFCVQSMRFCLPESHYMRTLSGADTRAVSANISIETQNVASGHNLTVYAECTSELRVGTGRQVEIIQ